MPQVYDSMSHAQYENMEATGGAGGPGGPGGFGGGFGGFETQVCFFV